MSIWRLEGTRHRAFRIRAATARIPHSSWQRLLAVSQRISGDCDHRRILRQFFGHNFVERIGGGVMTIKIETAVLNRTEGRHTGFFDGLDVGSTMLYQIEHACT